MSDDININESAILETLNAKIDYDGGNYKGSGLANYVVDKTGDTMTGDLTINKSRPSIYFDNPTVDATLTPNAWTALGSIYIRDMNKAMSGYIENSLTTSNNINILIGARRIIDNKKYSSDINLTVDASGKSYFEFPRCTTKATTTSSASSNKVAVIVQNYVNGTSWYRVYSDGWCEQGGRTGSSAGGTARTVTLLKAFSNTDYYVGLTSYTGGSGSVQYNNFQCTKKTTSDFTAKAGCNESLVLEWQACGYIA